MRSWRESRGGEKSVSESSLPSLSGASGGRRNLSIRKSLLSGMKEDIIIVAVKMGRKRLSTRFRGGGWNRPSLFGEVSAKEEAILSLTHRREKKRE